MTAVFALTWHSCRLGLHAWPLGRAGLTALRETLGPSGLSKQHVHSMHRLLERSKVFPPPAWDARPTIALYELLPQLSGQARCVSLPKSRATEPSKEKADQNETSMSRAEIDAIFGLELRRKDSNDLLERLQEQRHRGTLDQKLPYPDVLIDKGLKFLRAKYPFDEDAAIIARIDREADEEFRLPQTNIEKSPHAVSQFEKLFRDNKQRREEEIRNETRKQQGVGEEGPKEDRRITVRDGTALVQLHPEPEWIRKHRGAAQMKKVPRISTLAKLLPSGLLTAAVLTVAVLFAQNYMQPSRQARLWPDIPPAAATVIALISANVAVFMLWRVPSLWKPMNRIFLVVPAYPHSMSMLTASFSHQELRHLLTNIIPLWLIGTRRMSAVGPFLSDLLGLTMLNSTR